MNQNIQSPPSEKEHRQ